MSTETKVLHSGAGWSVVLELGAGEPSVTISTSAALDLFEAFMKAEEAARQMSWHPKFAQISDLLARLEPIFDKFFEASVNLAAENACSPELRLAYANVSEITQYFSQLNAREKPHTAE